MKNFDLGILFARLGLGICLFMHGFAKILHGLGGVKGILVKAGLPEFMAYFAYVGEVVAPLMIILGVFSRIGALLIVATSFTILYAYNGLRNSGEEFLYIDGPFRRRPRSRPVLSSTQR